MKPRTLSQFQDVTGAICAIPGHAVICTPFTHLACEPGRNTDCHVDISEPRHYHIGRYTAQKCAFPHVQCAVHQAPHLYTPCISAHLTGGHCTTLCRVGGNATLTKGEQQVTCPKGVHGVTLGGGWRSHPTLGVYSWSPPRVGGWGHRRCLGWETPRG